MSALASTEWKSALISEFEYAAFQKENKTKQKHSGIITIRKKKIGQVKRINKSKSDGGFQTPTSLLSAGAIGEFIALQ